MGFDEIAAPLLANAAGQLGELTWEMEPDAYQRLQVPEGAPVDAILKLLPRRGLDPRIASRLLDAFPMRPVERALLAWDVLTGSLLGADDGEIFTRAAEALAPLKAFGPARPAAVPRDKIIELALAVHGQDDADPTLPSLGSLTGAPSAEVIAAALPWAKRLSRAHLPSLGLAFAQLLWTRTQSPEALDVLLEIAIDHRLIDAVPLMAGEDKRSLEQQTYFLVRERLAAGDPDAAKVMLAAVVSQPERADSTVLPLMLASLQLSLTRPELPNPIFEKSAEEALAGDPHWLYAASLRDVLGLRREPERSAQILDFFISDFGNHPPLWAEAARQTAQRAPVLAVLSRELRYQVHDPNAWRGFTHFVDTAEVRQWLTEEIEERLASQLASVFGADAPAAAEASTPADIAAQAAHAAHLDALLVRLDAIDKSIDGLGLEWATDPRMSPELVKSLDDQHLALQNERMAAIDEACAALAAFRTDDAQGLVAWADSHDQHLAALLASPEAKGESAIFERVFINAKRAHEAWAQLKAGENPMELVGRLAAGLDAEKRA